MTVAPHATELLETDPVPMLLQRVRGELSAEFRPGRPIRLSRAPGRLDVMGGIADYTGSLVLQSTLDCAAAVALQQRDDDQLQVFSFNQLDDHKPFTLRMSMRSLAMTDVNVLRREFADPNRQWAVHLAGCVRALHADGFLDLANPAVPGISLALLNTVPQSAAAGSSAAVEVATMLNLVDHYDLRARLDAMQLAVLCQTMTDELALGSVQIKDVATCCAGEPNSLLRMLCQPRQLQPPLRLPQGVTVFGIDSGVDPLSGRKQYDRMRSAAFMGHQIILDQMRRLGNAAGATLTGDPMNGYLANLSPDDYKILFRFGVPEAITGREFVNRYGPMLKRTLNVDPDESFAVQHATDHHVLEARRVRRFVEFIESASSLPPGPQRKRQLDMAGHLMYASHQSYTMDAMLGCDQCDWLVDAVRQREYAGLYGARITAAGSGATVAVLADDSDGARSAITEITEGYRAHSGRKSHSFFGSSNGAWRLGTVVV